jgi:hypothetical protein
MKKIVLIALLVAMATPVLAAPRDGVLDSMHDMRQAVGAVDFGGNDRVCAFCHTPHHAYLSTNADDYYPLWARELDVESFDPYYTATINAQDYNTDVAVGPTRLCMSCHDGSIAPDQHYGVAGVLPGLTDDGWNGAGVGFIGGGLGNGLTNDHPVGFNYVEVAIGPTQGNPTVGLVTGAADNQDPWIRAVSDASGDLAYDSNPYALQVQDRLYQGVYMTCATCHDVHNKMNADDPAQLVNYLVLAPQADSALCLTCHIK